MDTKIVKVSLGLSLPFTMVVGYAAYKFGEMVGKFEAYKDVAVNKKEDSEDE